MGQELPGLPEAQMKEKKAKDGQQQETLPVPGTTRVEGTVRHHRPSLFKHEGGWVKALAEVREPGGDKEKASNGLISWLKARSS